MKEKIKFAVGVLLGAGAMVTFAAATRILSKNRELEEDTIELPFEIEEVE